MKFSSILALSTIVATPGLAQETRQMGSHEHGVSTLELAIDGNVVEMNLTSPGADIVGFEYAASTADDKDAVEAAIRMMLTPENIVALPDAAECRLSEVLAHLHGDDHGEEGHEDHEDEEHEDHGEEDHDDHAEEDGHDDHADEDGAEHSEFHARYIFACEHTDELTEIALPFFEAFENAQEIEATYITDAGAGVAEIERDAPTLDLN